MAENCKLQYRKQINPKQNNNILLIYRFYEIRLLYKIIVLRKHVSK